MWRAIENHDMAVSLTELGMSHKLIELTYVRLNLTIKDTLDVGTKLKVRCSYQWRLFSYVPVM